MGQIRVIYESRSILKALIIKNLKGKYSSSLLGIMWHFFTPLLLMTVYYVAFSTIRSNAIPNFWVYLSSGLFAFSYMMSCLIGGTHIITSASGMIKKIYFPRELFVLSHALSNFIIMLIGYLIVLIAILFSNQTLGISILYLPIGWILLFFFSTGIALFLSSITVYLRDVQYLISSISMAFYFLTPMYFLVENTEGLLSDIIWLNPLTYYVEFFHEILFYSTIPSCYMILSCIVISSISFFVGIFVFNKLKGGFAERL